MQVATLAIAKDPGEFEDLLLSGRQKLLAGKFGRGAQVRPQTRAIGPSEFGTRCVEMSLVARRNLQDAGLDLDETPALEPGADSTANGAAGQ